MMKHIDLMLQQLEHLLTQSALSQQTRVEVYNALSDLAYMVIGLEHPALNVKLIPRCMLKDNDYNPNNVAPPEYRLLKHSMKTDGVTMPVVVNQALGEEHCVIIDGYHRSQLLKHDLDLQHSLASYVPVVILNKREEERIATSVRHNMARGTHQVELTAQLVAKLKSMNVSDEEIGKEIGMDKEEVLRMQQVLGLAELFKDRDFSCSWK
ncbi:IbrB-like domain-containing protein [Vibrio harveyi]|uniref:IbrB-like domain-containing protein n=1 Tax=Vibrio harveyi TaxID=669 RepID=UPI001C0E91E4|nr:ParB/RepB/Spo0J family partition protein [Vibrio harveyi]